MGLFGGKNKEVAELIAKIESEDVNEKKHAIVRIGKIGEEKPDSVIEAIPLLIEELSSASPRVRSSAASALGKIGELRPKLVLTAMDKLQELRLEDPDWAVRNNAVAAVRKIEACIEQEAAAKEDKSESADAGTGLFSFLQDMLGQ